MASAHARRPRVRPENGARDTNRESPHAAFLAALAFTLAASVSGAVFADANDDPRAAAGEGPVARVAAALSAGADPNARDEDGKLPFDYAKENAASRRTEACWRLNDARFE